MTAAYAPYGPAYDCDPPLPHVYHLSTVEVSGISSCLEVQWMKL